MRERSRLAKYALYLINGGDGNEVDEGYFLSEGFAGNRPPHRGGLELGISDIGGAVDLALGRGLLVKLDGLGCRQLRHGQNGCYKPRGK